MDAPRKDSPFYLLAEGSPEAIFVLTDEQFFYLNSSALNLFGATSPDQLLGQSIRERSRNLLPKPLKNTSTDPLDLCGKLVEQSFLKLDGSTIEVEVSCVPIRFKDQHSHLVFARDISQRKAAEREIRGLNHKLEKLLDQRNRMLQIKESELHKSAVLQESILTESASGVLVYQAEGPCILANPAAAGLVGCSTNDLLQQNFRNIPSWRDSGLLDTALRALESDQTEALESLVRTSFGKELWAFFQFSGFENQGARYLLLLMHDISEFKRVTRELAEREQQFRTLAENVPDHIARFDTQGRAVYLNPSLQHALGHPAADLIGLTPAEFEDDGRFDGVQQALLQVAASGEPAHVEQPVPDPDGGLRHHSIRIVPERDEDGRIVHLLAVGHDQTEIRQANEELRLAASVFHNSADGVMITDAQGKFVSVNPAFTEITGFTEEDVQGQTPRLLRSNRQGEDFYKQMWQSLTDSGQWQGELWNRRKDGEAILIWNTINRIDDEHGQPVRYVSVFHDITELRRKDEHIHHLAFHDALTGIPNRILLLDRLQHAINLAQRENTRLAVIMFDLDRFKSINDGLGHDTGDLLLQEIAQRVKRRLRVVDTVARLYGDEFVILTEDLPSTEACAHLAEEVLLAISRPMTMKGQTFEVGASLGIAVYPDDGADHMELLKHADMAMYAAKNAGRNTYRFFQQDMLELASKRLSLELELRRAIANGELVLFYQPKVRMSDETLAGLEALVRWRHPEQGLMPPSEFIPLAEDCGLIMEVGAWVIEQSCRQIAAWRDQGYEVRVAVNVSARQLDYYDLAEQISGMTAEHGISPANLEIELTESTVMSDPEEVIDLLRRLRELGVTVAIDDFGTGYSSLAYLRRLPLNVLKIDRSFVQEVEINEEDAQIVKTILALGHALKFKVVAEGIETQHHANMLRSLGCDMGQGYLYSKPLPAEQIGPWLERINTSEPSA